MLTLSAPEINALDSDTLRIGVFFRMQLVDETVVRWWLGIGDCQVGINAYDEAAALYQGFGQLIDVPAVQQLINGVAERVRFTISGVSSETMALASSESDDVKGSIVALGIVFFGAQWQQLGVPKWLFRGRGDFVKLNQEPGGTAGAAAIRSIELSVGSLFTGRRRRGLSYLTDRDQQERYPGDKFCERTILYSREVEKVWPRYV